MPHTNGLLQKKEQLDRKSPAAQFGSLHEIPDKDMEERGKRERLKKVK